jgi:hypothetical protein
MGAIPTVFTSTYLEGLGDALNLAEKDGDIKRANFYRRRCHLGYRWLMSLQFDSGIERGGFRRSPEESRIRIDNTQHSISAMMREVNPN